MVSPILLIPILASFFVTLFIIPFWIRKAKQIGLVWKDMNKLSHEKVAGSGGIIAVFGFIIGVLFYIAYSVFILDINDSRLIEILALLNVILISAGVGLIDDLFGWQHGGLSRRSRLILVFLAAIPLMAINAGKSTVSLPFLGVVNLGIFYPLIIIPIGIIGATYTFNFLAGYNGLEAGQGIILLSAVGIKTNIENIGLEDVGIVTDRDKVLVNDFYQTNIPGYYAIGDITPGPALAHVASAEGILCVEKIAGQHVEAIDYGNIPGCTYCSPEIASVGMTEAQTKDAGYDIKVGNFPFSASGKASAAGTKDGFVKVIFDAKYGEWLGCHMIGAGVTDMIAEAVLGRKLETTGHEVLKAIHPHPTMSEAVMEAVADAYDEVIHL